MVAVLVVTVFDTADVFYVELAAFAFKLLALVGLPEAGLALSALAYTALGP